jgi:hypothetical protein
VRRGHAASLTTTGTQMSLQMHLRTEKSASMQSIPAHVWPQQDPTAAVRARKIGMLAICSIPASGYLLRSGHIQYSCEEKSTSCVVSEG